MAHQETADGKLVELPSYQNESIDKPSKPYNPNLRTGAPLWEEEVNDPTACSVAWHSLFHIEGTDEFVVEYRNFTKRDALDSAVREKAKTAKATATEMFADPQYANADAVNVDVDGLTFTVHAPLRWATGFLDEPTVDTDPHLTKREDWIYDLTDNNIGKFIIDGWKALNPERYAALPKTPEELEARNRRWAEEYRAELAREARSRNE